jgi:hypothetical protein
MSHRRKFSSLIARPLASLLAHNGELHRVNEQFDLRPSLSLVLRNVEHVASAHESDVGFIDQVTI